MVSGRVINKEIISNMGWTEDDDKMLSSIEMELLTSIDAYEFTFGNPHSTIEEKENTEKGIKFKYKQIDWLRGIKDRVMTSSDKEEIEKKKNRCKEILASIHDIESQIRDIYGISNQANTNGTIKINAVNVNIQQIMQAKSLEDKRRELQEELKKLKFNL